MPTISVNRAKLFLALGKTYTDAEFDELCFEFGIELDEVTSEKKMKQKEVGGDKVSGETSLSDEVIYRIDVPANRYDLLCLEGLSRALLAFLKKSAPPTYTAVKPKEAIAMRVTENCASIRPYVVAAVLRDVTFTETSYASFIDLQDKLHQNICRKRTLVAIGTHDLDTLTGPFTYDARDPKDIVFAPLGRDKAVDGHQLMENLSSDLHLKKYLPIIRDSPRYPVIVDAKGVVLSLPPIINGEHSKIRLTTKNVLVECTGTDHTKAHIVLNTVLTMFAVYAAKPFEATMVDVTYPDGSKVTCPDFTYHQFTTSVDYINKAVGVALTAEQIVDLLNRMCLVASKDATTEGKINVKVPPTRSDILHECDIMEDVAIAYGYNNLKHSVAPTNKFGAQQPLNLISDLIRREIAQAGYTESLNFALCSHDENFAYLNHPDDGTTAVTLGNPKTIEFQVVRTSLLPGLLKSLSHNKDLPLPIKIFEVSDVVVKDPAKDVGARNKRRLCAVYCNSTDSFEVIHGLVDHVMMMLRQARGGPNGYSIRACQDATYFPDRCAEVIVKGERVGLFGVLHPEVVRNFELVNPCSALEIDIERFL